MRRGGGNSSRTPHSRTTSPIAEASEEAELMAELAAGPSATDIEVLQPPLSGLQVWVRRVQGTTRLLLSGALLPDPLKSHPYTAPAVGAILLLLFLLPIRLYCVLILGGICLGYVLAAPAAVAAGSSQSRGERTLLDRLMAPLGQNSKHHPERQPPSAAAKLAISPNIDTELDSLLEAIIKDVINAWYVPLCKSGEDDFQACVRSTINAAIMNLIRFASTRNKDTITLMLYGITNALIVHMEEYRLFEEAKGPMDKFMDSGLGRRTYMRSYCQELDHLRQVAGLLLKKLLPKQESRSILLNSLLREVISGNALVGLIDRISDPDFINEQIVKFLQDPAEAAPEVESGWNMVVLKVFRAKNLPSHPGSGGVYLVIHMAGRRVKTKRIKDPNQLWNEVFRFKVSDSVRDHLKIYIQLCEFNYLGQDHSLGYAKLVPHFGPAEAAIEGQPDHWQKPSWLKFTVKAGTGDQPVNKAAMAPKVLVQLTTVVGGGGGSKRGAVVGAEPDASLELSREEQPPSASLPACQARHVEEEERGGGTSINNNYEDQSESPRPSSSYPTAGTLVDAAAASAPDHGAITLEAALQNNELFMEFLEYLNSVKAPPYLQFMMNVDALRQFAAMSLGVESKATGSLEEYFRGGGPLSSTQIEQLKMIKHDAADVFSMHFMESSKYRVPLDPGMQQELQEWVNRSDRIDPQGMYVGGPIGPNIFLPAYRWVADILEEVYFPKFKGSETFLRFLDRAKFSVLSFPLDDDRISTYSHDSGMPSNWAYGDQSYTERQAALSVGGGGDANRSRTGSFENLEDIEAAERAEAKRLATQIAINKEKLAVIEEQMLRLGSADGKEHYHHHHHHHLYQHQHQHYQAPSQQDSSPPLGGTMSLKELQREQEYLQSQIKSLVALLEEKSEAPDERAEELWTDLTNARIRVSLTQDAKFVAGSEGVFSSIWSSTMGSMMSAVSEPVFDVEVARPERAEGGSPASGSSVSMVTRSYSEFRGLHRRLRKEFPKVGKIPFPEHGLLSVDGLDQSLETYLRLLASDEFVRQSNVLRQFVSIDGGLDAKTSLFDAVLGKRVKTAFKSARSMLSGAPADSAERREHFYETRERHTTTDLLERIEMTEGGGGGGYHQTSRPPSATAMSLTDLPSSTPSPRKSVPRPSTSSAPHADDVGRTARLLTVPSMELPAAAPPTLPGGGGGAPLAKGEAAASVVEELTEAEIDMLVETFFAFIIETFDLREPNQWLRRKLLGVFKQLLKQAYGDTLNKVATGLINQAFSEDSIIRALREVKGALYPEGIFIGRMPPPLVRSEEQKFATMVEARTVFLKHTPDFVQNMAGRYNAICGMTRIFHALQYKDFNKALIYACIDIVLKLFFSERPTS